MWLQSILRAGGGPFTDTFRAVHPDRRDAYTCFSTASGAAAFNYGSRIDLVLVAGPCQHAEQLRAEHGSLARQGGGWGGHGAGGVGTAEADGESRKPVETTSGQREELGGASQCSIDDDGSLERSFELNEGRGRVAGTGGLSGSLQAHLFEEFREAVRRHSTGGTGAAAVDGTAQSGADTAAGSPQSTAQGTEDAPVTQKEQNQAEGPFPNAGEGPHSQNDGKLAASVDTPAVQSGDALWPCSGEGGSHGVADCEVVAADIASVFPGSSDHRPVFVRLRPQPEGPLHRVPPLSTRFMPELRGKQTRIREPERMIPRGLLERCFARPCTLSYGWNAAGFLNSAKRKELLGSFVAGPLLSVQLFFRPNSARWTWT